MITSQKELRKAFWATFPKVSRKKVSFGRELHYGTDTRVLFHEWKDSLRKDGEISSRLCDSATLG